MSTVNTRLGRLWLLEPNTSHEDRQNQPDSSTDKPPRIHQVSQLRKAIHS
ncbi:hypothetical protein BY996DRAFT_6552584 [Phakopsora pachyrhizi]|nr:hypothetical protein BY996DRAFT_6552584 [Phakopsora pachyrhizi]